MKKYLFYLLVFLLPSLGMGQKNNCSKFKNGTFKKAGLSSDSEYVIIRKDTIQIEEDFKTGLKTELKVKWISECVYTLEPIRHLKNPEDQKFPEGEIITVTIIDVNKNSYTQESISNQWKGKRKEEYLKVKK